MTKEYLRSEMRQKLKAVDTQLYQQMSTQLSIRLAYCLVEISKQKFFEKLGVYAPMLNEPAWFYELKSDAYEFLLVHMQKDHHLSFHPVELDQLRDKKFQLELPAEVLKVEKSPEVILVPGLAFTKQGERLGRGHAYYDRYLKDHKAVKVGLCFEMQLLEDVFNEKHDIVMDYVVTEKDIYRRG